MSNSNTNLQTPFNIKCSSDDTVSSCSISKVQEKTQLSEVDECTVLKEIKVSIKFLSEETLLDYWPGCYLQENVLQDLDLLEQHLTKDNTF
ncbi:hypothetical protein Tco_1166999 [Tanacetum coccineum]